MSVGSFVFLHHLYIKKVLRLEHRTDPRNKYNIVECLAECAMPSDMDPKRQFLKAAMALNNRGSYTVDMYYCHMDGRPKAAFRYGWNEIGGCHPDSPPESIIDLPYVSPKSEIQVSDIIKSTRELYELFTHISPELYDLAHRRAYHRFCRTVLDRAGGGDLAYALSSFSRIIREEVLRAEQRSHPGVREQTKAARS